jgi:hypothetical protein
MLSASKLHIRILLVGIAFIARGDQPCGPLAGNRASGYSLAAVRVPARKTEMDAESPEGKLLVSWVVTGGDGAAALVDSLPALSLRDRLLT